MTMRKQGYAIIGIGLAALAGIFWLAKFHSNEKTTITAIEPTAPNQETTATSKTEQKVDHFAGMRRQLPSFIDSQTEGDKTIEAELKKEKTYENSPRGSHLETYRDDGEYMIDLSKKRIAEYKNSDAAGRAVLDLDDWIIRQRKRRYGEYLDVMWEALDRTGNTNLYRPQDLPANTATVAEEKATKAISKIKTGWAREPEPWQEVAAFLRDRRDFSQTELNQGDPEDPNWHADHIQWIEQTAQTIGIPLDNPDDESWIQEKIAAAKEQRYQDLDAPLIEELKKIDEEMAAAFEAWAREPDGKDKEVATRHNQLIKQRKQQLAKQEHERHYREEMARNPVFKEMERERQRKERIKARQAEEPAQETPTSSESE